MVENKNTPKIVSVGTFLPNEPVDNQIINQKFSINAEWIEITTGNVSRHFSVDLQTGEVSYTLEDLATEAALNAIEKGGIDPDDIDLVIMSSATPDALMPATVNKVIERLGINHVPTYQLQSGCAGAMQGLDLAHLLLRLGKHHTALVIGADTCTKHIDFKRDCKGLPASEIINYALFGDGAGAAIVTTDDASSGVSILSTLNRCEGLNKKPGQEVFYYGAAGKPDNFSALFEDYKAIETDVPVMADETLSELLAHEGWAKDDITWFMPPQLSRAMSDRIAAHLALPEDKCLHCVGETGNNGNALPFLQLSMMMDRIEDGQRAVGVAIESSKWIKSGIVLEKRQ